MKRDGRILHAGRCSRAVGPIRIGEHGGYVEAKSEAQLVDQLNPRYLTRVIRVDPWHQPYEYEGARASFVLRSSGPDGKPNTGDDVTVSH